MASFEFDSSPFTFYQFAFTKYDEHNRGVESVKINGENYPMKEDDYGVTWIAVGNIVYDQPMWDTQLKIVRDAVGRAFKKLAPVGVKLYVDYSYDGYGSTSLSIGVKERKGFSALTVIAGIHSDIVEAINEELMDFHTACYDLENYHELIENNDGDAEFAAECILRAMKATGYSFDVDDLEDYPEVQKLVASQLVAEKLSA